MSPDFYKCLMSVASGMHDERLERVAFEGYFHSLVRRRQVIKLHLFEYLNKKLTNLSIEEKTPQSLGCLTWTELPVVVTEGENVDEGVYVMTEWAKNPSKMDYWIPNTSLFETVDAVAKWKEDGQVQFALLQLTKGETHKCDGDVITKLTKPFLDHGHSIRYIAIVPTEEIQKNLSPVVVKGVHADMLRVAYLEDSP
ncbi:hypothetical protein Poli38472_011812 [Pythium oligandrum]|uniref:Uncharacterized protein n=1 Tax=Pythium oligandrum TaxID=41045 RepID=A0A8K1C7S1_PYTOL|nr:hypothetical protein Poli38472_011812 [Pythium oligandrum]|eukprot:TMW58224.1 hypothetical protein Poli38472_011812 [Pythium oligandrum]